MTHQGYLEIKTIFCRKLLYSGKKNQTFVLKFEYYPVSLCSSEIVIAQK